MKDLTKKLKFFRLATFLISANNYCLSEASGSVGAKTRKDPKQPPKPIQRMTSKNFQDQDEDDDDDLNLDDFASFSA